MVLSALMVAAGCGAPHYYRSGSQNRYLSQKQHLQLFRKRTWAVSFCFSIPWILFKQYPCYFLFKWQQANVMGRLLGSPRIWGPVHPWISNHQLIFKWEILGNQDSRLWQFPGTPKEERWQTWLSSGCVIQNCKMFWVVSDSRQTVYFQLSRWHHVTCGLTKKVTATKGRRHPLWTP